MLANGYRERRRGAAAIRPVSGGSGFPDAIRAWLTREVASLTARTFPIYRRNPGYRRAMKPSTSYWRVLATLLLTAAISAHAADKPKKVKYVAPSGFDGHEWGELRTSPGFAKLPLEAIGVGAAWMRPVEEVLSVTGVPESGVGWQVGVVRAGGDIPATVGSM